VCIETLPMVLAEIDLSLIGSLNSFISWSYTISFNWDPSILILLNTGDTVTPEILRFCKSKLLCFIFILFNNPPCELKALNFVLSNKKLLAFIFNFLSDSTIGIFKKLRDFLSSSWIYNGTLNSPALESRPKPPNEGFWLSFPPNRNYEKRLDVELFAWRGTRSDCTIYLFCKIG